MLSHFSQGNFSRWIGLIGLLLSSDLAHGQLFEVPGKWQYCHLDTNGGYSVLPSGRYVKPVGKLTRLNKAPFGLAVTPDGQKALTLHPDALTITDTRNGLQPKRMPPYGTPGINAINRGTFTGLIVTPDSRYAWLSGGNSGMIWKLNLETGTFCDSLNTGPYHPEEPDAAFITELAWGNNGHILALDRAWECLYDIDPANKQLARMIPAGIIPFSITAVQGRNQVLFAHVGLYRYPLVPGVSPENRDTFMLKFPPYAAHTDSSELGTFREGRQIPGLGSPNSPDGMSVWLADLNKGSILNKWKTGRSIGTMLEDGAEVVGGAHPCHIVSGKNYAYVSNAQNDLISVIHLKKRKISSSIPIRTGTFLDSMRGYMPYGMALDEENNRLYVACMGLNAVAVINTLKGNTIGFIPTGWGPVKVVWHKPSGMLYITSIRGLGAGPNGGKGFIMPPQGNYVGDIQLGTLQQLAYPDDRQLAAWRDTVLSYTFREYKAAPISPPSVKHIVYITKENRTYDEVFGQRKGGLGDSSIARFGVNCSYLLPDSLRPLYDNLKVSPNHHALADRYAISDNFYCDSDASIHGHHWMMGTIPNEYVETNSAYRGDFRTFSKASGRRFPRTTGAMDPEDYNEKGGFWEALLRNKISVYNFGEANEYTGVWEEWDHLENGARQPVAFPMPAAIYPYTCREYAGYNTNIPDQVRVQQFEKVFRERWIEGKDTLPTVITIQLPNDHTASPRPEDGYPSRASYMADNDLALGRMIDFLSHTRYWNDMLIVVVEDDAQGGVDHIDAHRSLLMMAGPWVKSGYISHTHANFGTVVRTIYHLLGIPPVNHYDATATLLLDFFNNSGANASEFNFKVADPRVFDAVQSLKKYQLPSDWLKAKSGEPMDNEQKQRMYFYQEKS